MTDRPVGMMLWISGATCAVVMTMSVLWWKLPQWQPEWVGRYSPFVDPVLRSVEHDPAVERFVHIRLRGPWGASAVPHLLRRLDSADTSTNMRALLWLVETGDPRVGPAYLSILERDDVDLVAFACAGLAAIKPTPVGDIAAIARRRLAASADPALLGEFARLLAPHLDLPLLPLALDLASATRTQRQAGRNLVGLAGLPLNARLATLRHPDPVLVRLALEGIGLAWSRGGDLDPDLLPALLIIAEGEDAPARAHALTMIAALLGEGAGPRLARALDDPVDVVALRALDLLGRIPGPSTLPWLRRALTGERTALHQPASTLLADSPLAEALPILALGETNADPLVRERAAAAQAQIRSSGSP